MRVVRIGVTLLLMMSLATSVRAGDLREAAEKAGAAAAQEGSKRPVNTMMIAGTSLFVAGMAEMSEKFKEMGGEVYVDSIATENINETLN